MRLRSLLSRRPSAAIVISVTALFMSMGGVGYAAISIPNNSVNTAQIRNNAVTNSKIRNNAVTFKKILPGSVGIVRANTGQLQVRVGGSCSSGTAIGAIDQLGKVTCNSANPSEYGTSGTATVTSTATPVASKALPGPSPFLAFANPTVTVTSAGADHVTVSCTLSVGGNVQSRDVTFDTGASGTHESESIPLQVAGPAGNSSVVCQSAAGSTSPTVSVTSSLNAIQTSSNG